jgi:sarcosine oxidase
MGGRTFDTIVIGVGAMGAAASYHLAMRGQRVLGLEQFSIGHDRGSSHGETRLIRQAYFENASYVPLLLRAYELWEEIAAKSGEDILVRNGLVIYGRPERSSVYQGTLRSGRLYNIPMQELSRAEAIQRFPIYQPPEGFGAVFEPGAGFLHAERALKAHARQAGLLGAEIREREEVLSWSAEGEGVKVRTSHAEYSAARLVITGGGWSQKLLRELGLPLSLRRMRLGWFRAGAAQELSRGAPCFIFDLDDDFYYGFPMIDHETFKMASHHGYELMENPEEKDAHEPTPARIEALRSCIRRCLPSASTELVRAAHCIYTMTPDEDFVIDRHPLFPQVSFASGFSGHGFKFASVVGEILADLALHGKTRHPIDFLSASRAAIKKEAGT